MDADAHFLVRVAPAQSGIADGAGELEDAEIGIGIAFD
jgi:hypothetical protein